MRLQAAVMLLIAGAQPARQKSYVSPSRVVTAFYRISLLFIAGFALNRFGLHVEWPVRVFFLASASCIGRIDATQVRRAIALHLEPREPGWIQAR